MDNEAEEITSTSCFRGVVECGGDRKKKRRNFRSLLSASHSNFLEMSFVLLVAGASLITLILVKV